MFVLQRYKHYVLNQKNQKKNFMELQKKMKAEAPPIKPNKPPRRCP